MQSKIFKTCGIICEYNPFHFGHEYQLKEAKKVSGADLMICLLSGPFTQRGSASLLLPQDRAHMALLGGADVVFELPAFYALREAEHFALGGVSLLSGLGVSALSFGSENEDLALLKKFASFLNHPPKPFNDELKKHLDTGTSFPKAQFNALSSFFDHKEVNILSHPNNILSVAYLRAIDKYHLSMETFPIKRLGHYHDSQFVSSSILPSATALRSAIYRRDWQKMEAMVPENSFEVLKEALAQSTYHLPDALDLPLLYYLRSIDADYLNNYFDLEPGLQHKIIQSAKISASRKELIFNIKSKRYTYTRINRLLSQILLKMDSHLLSNTSSFFPLRLLGFKQNARPWLAEKKELLYAKAADRAESPAFTLDMGAYDLWALGARLPRGLGYRQSPIVI